MNRFAKIKFEDSRLEYDYLCSDQTIIRGTTGFLDGDEKKFVVVSGIFYANMEDMPLAPEQYRQLQIALTLDGDSDYNLAMNCLADLWAVRLRCDVGLCPQPRGGLIMVEQDRLLAVGYNGQPLTCGGLVAKAELTNYLARLNVTKWQREYGDYRLTDGESWEFTLYIGNRRFVCKGYNKYPRGFNRIRKLFEEKKVR